MVSSSDALGTLRRRLLVFLVVLDVLYVVNCLAPFFGLKFETSQAMYSELQPKGTNHLLIPPMKIFDFDTYVRTVRVEVPEGLKDEAAGLRWFTDWTRRNDRDVHLGFFDYHFARLCAAEPTARIGFSFTREDGSRERREIVCAEAGVGSYFPIGLYPACEPACDEQLEDWASGRFASGEAADDR
jgi:hypothetical protein